MPAATITATEPELLVSIGSILAGQDVPARTCAGAPLAVGDRVLVLEDAPDEFYVLGVIE